jgi:hypothetical protein
MPAATQQSTGVTSVIAYMSGQAARDQLVRTWPLGASACG